MTAPILEPDYLDAMERHWLDAEQLFHLTPSRLANADHLYGLSAECGLKALMAKWGMKLNNNIPADPKDRKHADTIWNRYETYQEGRLPALSLPRRNAFASWSIHHRYANRSYFQQTVVDGHRKGAAIVKQLVHQARIQGVLP